MIHDEHVRKDGTLDDTYIETFYQPLEYVVLGGVEPNQYLRIVSDGPGYNVETRLPLATLIAAGLDVTKLPRNPKDEEAGWSQ